MPDTPSHPQDDSASDPQSGTSPPRTPPGTFDLAPEAPSPSPVLERALDRERERVERAAERQAAAAAEENDDAPPPAQPLLRTDLGNSNFYLALAGVVLVIACVLGARNTRPDQEWLPAVISTLYNAVLHSFTGLAAAWVWSRIEARPLGSWRDVLARMSVAVALAWLFFNLDFGLDAKLEEPLLGVGAYLGALIVLMRWAAPRALRVACVHFAIAFVIFLAMIIHVWASSGR